MEPRHAACSNYSTALQETLSTQATPRLAVLVDVVIRHYKVTLAFGPLLYPHEAQLEMNDRWDLISWPCSICSRMTLPQSFLSGIHHNLTLVPYEAFSLFLLVTVVVPLLLLLLFKSHSTSIDWACLPPLIAYLSTSSTILPAIWRFATMHISVRFATNSMYCCEMIQQRGPVCRYKCPEKCDRSLH